MVTLNDSLKLAGANKKFAVLYDRIAPFYDVVEDLACWLKLKSPRRVDREILNGIRVAETDRILDVGIGTGRHICLLNPKASYFGVDMSLAMLNCCQRKVERRDLDCKLFHGVAENLPFPDNHFDAVLSFGGFNFFDNQRAAMSEFVRVCKNHGRIYIGDETEKHATLVYERIPLVRKWFAGRDPIMSPEKIVREFGSDFELQLFRDGHYYRFDIYNRKGG